MNVARFQDDSPEILRFLTDDVDEMREASRRWNNSYRQLVPGQLAGNILIYQLKQIQLVRIGWSQATVASGVAPPNTVTMGIPVDYTDTPKWYGHPLSHQQVYFPHYSRDHHFIASGKLTVFSISIDETLLSSYATAYDISLPEKLLTGQIYVLQPSPTAVTALTHYMHNLFAMIEQTDRVASLPAMQHFIRHDFLPLFLNACLPQKEICSADIPGAQFELVKQIERFVIEHPGEPLTLHELCQRFSMSRRKLHYLFQDIVGMAPMTYLKAQRLNGVRRQFKTCTDPTKTVTAIASQWGFWHMGHFSQDYKMMFGESPSTTLKQSIQHLL